MRIIGLSGYARVGKDSVAAILFGHGYQRKAFADPLYHALTLLNPHLKYKNEYFPLQDLIAWHGWDNIKEFAPQARELLQRLGTEVGRNTLGEDIWVNTAMNWLNPDGRYVFTDVRFPNEAKAILARGGFVVRIDRPGFGPANSHISEVGLNDWPCDGHIVNSGTLADLAVQVEGVLLSLDSPALV